MLSPHNDVKYVMREYTMQMYSFQRKKKEITHEKK